MSVFEYRILADHLPYTGTELRPGWVAEAGGPVGDGGVGFIGPCNVPTAHLVDLDDARAGCTIVSAVMVHVVIEHLDINLELGVCRQRLLVLLASEYLRDRGIECRRDGDDIFVEGRKLTVSIAAPFSSGAMIHLGVNVDPSGAPVAAVGLDQLGVVPREFLESLLDSYKKELAAIAYATKKVRTVG